MFLSIWEYFIVFAIKEMYIFLSGEMFFRKVDSKDGFILNWLKINSKKNWIKYYFYIFKYIDKMRIKNIKYMDSKIFWLIRVST